MQSLEFEAIGTTWNISYDTERSCTEVEHGIKSLIESFDERYSRFRSDSFVRSIAEAPGTFILSDDAEPMMNFYKKLLAVTNNKVTPLIGRLMEDAGYNETYSLKPGKLHKVPIWDDVLSYSHPVLQTYEPILFDFGAAGKGYLVDLVAAFFGKINVHDYVVNAGGDIYVLGERQIALEHPDRLDEAIGIATISHQAICGSAGNRRKWAQFTHIIDPVTQQSPHHIKATWVVADSAMVADGLSTALFFTDAQILKQEFSFEYAIVDQNGGLYSSSAFPANFFNT